MEVRHNTALLEQALDSIVQRASIPIKQAEAEAALKRARAVARRRLATGGAVAIAAVGLGLGIFLGLFQRDLGPGVLQSNAPLQERSAQPLSVPSSRAAPKVAGPEHGAVINYTKFADLDVSYNDIVWPVTAGHQYESDTDKMWSRAWCYTTRTVDGVLIRVDLAVRDSPFARPKAPIASSQSLAKVGLDDDAGIQLAARCPWLDGRQFQESDFLSPPARNVPSATTNIAQQAAGAQPRTAAPALPTVPSYVAKDGYDLPGNDLPNMPLAKESPLDCEQACNGAEGCVAYVFNKSFNKCFLKNAVGTLFENKTACTSVNQNNQIQRVSSFKFQTKTGIVGAFYRSIDSTKLLDCTTACDSDLNCQAFNYDTATSALTQTDGSA
jgi:PAN domain